MPRRGSTGVKVAIALAILLPVVSARAQSEPPPAGEPTPAAEPTPASDAIPAAAPDPNDRAWILYHAAFSALAKGDKDTARARLEELVRTYPDHPVSVRALEALALLGGSVSVKPDEPAPPDLRHEVKSKSARAELALLQTIHGIAV